MGKEEGGREYYKGKEEQVWKTQPVTEEIYNLKYKGKDKGAKDSRTGLWMFAVSEETCKASKGFVCKVSLYGRDVNDYDNVGNGDNDDDGCGIVWINMLKVNYMDIWPFCSVYLYVMLTFHDS